MSANSLGMIQNLIRYQIFVLVLIWIQQRPTPKCTMIKTYFKVTVRTLLRDKVTTLINVAGLTLGITTCLILFLIIRDGSSYDTHHSKFDRIYRVVSHSIENGRDFYTEGVPPALSEAIKNDFQEVEEVAFMSYRRSTLISVEQPDGTFKKYDEKKGVVITEPSFFKVFDRSMIIGDAIKGLDDPNEALISRAWADRYFGGEEVAIGKVVKHDDIEYTIRGVMQDYPSTTDLPFDLMLSYSTTKKSFDALAWSSVSDNDNCFFLLKENESIGKVDATMEAFAAKYLGTGDNNERRSQYLTQPMKTVHSDARFGTYNKKMPPSARISLIVIGIFMLIMACINFINLTTAEAVRRTKEVGIRKVLGSSRWQLITKFTGETCIVTVIAVLLSLALTQLLLMPINTFLDTTLSLQMSSDYRIWIFLAALTFGVSLLSGLYPAFVISRFKPAAVLKGTVNMKSVGNFNLRRSLVVMQFFISQLFIVGSIVVIKQLSFIENQDLGFKKDAIITVPIPEKEKVSATSKMRTLKNEIMRIASVEDASLNYSPPSSAGVLSTGFKLIDSNEELTAEVKHIDGRYLDLFAIDLIAGENLTDSDTTNAFIVNEKLVQTAGYASNEEIVGKEMELWGKRFTVRGVVKNFNTRSLGKPIEPVILINDIGGYNNLSVKLTGSNMQNAITEIQKLWEASYPEYLFKYEFLDEQVRNLYRGERKMSTMVTIFSFVAVFIGCLGLFGLISFMANQKVKEVGIRKVLGASVESIVLLFSKEFLKLIAIGFLLAAPASGFVMNKYLQEFAYKIELGPGIFIMALAVAILLALVTVGMKSFKAATADPARSLRSE